MKSLVLIAALFFAGNVFAATNEVKAEAVRVANVILDNPQAADELTAKQVNIIDYTISENDGGVNGVNVFTFAVDRTCFCQPHPGTLVITQDLRPTFADGPIKYSFQLQWK